MRRDPVTLGVRALGSFGRDPAGTCAGEKASRAPGYGAKASERKTALKSLLTRSGLGTYHAVVCLR